MRKKFLILNYGGIGDQILLFPALETIRSNFDNPLITLVTEPRSKAIGEITDLVDEVFICNLKDKSRFFELLKFLFKAYTGRYDAVISSGTSEFIPVILALTGIKERIGYDTGHLSRKLLTKAVRLNKNQYAANMLHDLISKEDNKEDKIPRIKPGAHTALYRVPGWNTERKTIVIHPGASRLSVKKGIIKCWAVENWVRLINLLLDEADYNVILTGGPDDAEVMKVFRRYFPGNVAKTSNIKEFVDIVSMSDLLVCVDSAPMHIGVGLRKRVIALFGPTDEKKLLPKHELFTAVRNDELECRPCLWDRRQVNCETNNCLNINPEVVFENIKEYF